MGTRELHSALQRSRAFPALRSFHARTGPPACAALHGLVSALGPRVFTASVTLKHRYEYDPIHVSPDAITRSLAIAAWRQLPEAQAASSVERARAWWQLGGAWKSCHRHVTRSFQGPFVLGGGWDLQSLPFHPRPVIRQLFIEGRQPRDTDEYAYLAERVRAGRYAIAHGCRSMEDLDRYFEEMIAAYHAIRENGYLSQRELGGDPGDEIRVVVDREGGLTNFGGGTHRLSMAKALDIPSVPVVIKRVHAEWVGVEPGDSRRDIIDRTTAAIGGISVR